MPLLTYSAPGGLRQDPGRAVESPAEARTCGHGSHEVRVLLSTMGSRGDVEPLLGLAVRLRALGAEVRVCAPPDEKFIHSTRRLRRLAGVGVPLVPAGARSVTEKLGIRYVLGRPDGRPGHRHGRPPAFA